VFPYFFATALAFVMPVKAALHVTVLLAVVSFPLGLVLCLRALQRPIWLALLAIPLVYHRGFYWGFVHFTLGIGLAFIVVSLLIGPWKKRTGLWLMGLCMVAAVTHIYALLVVFAYAAASIVSGKRGDLPRRLLWTVPALLALGAWGIFAANAPGYGITEWAPFDVRLKEFSHSILGGFADDSEDILLKAWAVVLVLLAAYSAPVTWRRFKQLSAFSRAAYLFVICNVVAYFLLPVATPTAKFIHFRHALLAATMAPLLVERLPSGVWTKVVYSVLVLLGGASLVNTWSHFIQFEREAIGFDEVLRSIPPRSNVAQLTYDSKGEVARTHAYLHFGAYAQAAKGGVFAVSFPILFWNIPIKGRADSGMPDTPKNMEWAPSRFYLRRMGDFYDTILVRNKPGVTRLHTYPGHELVLVAGAWQVYRAPNQ
jgi:hypothetical protein